jgi:hypothetical protein
VLDESPPGKYKKPGREDPGDANPAVDAPAACMAATPNFEDARVENMGLVWPRMPPDCTNSAVERKASSGSWLAGATAPHGGSTSLDTPVERAMAAVGGRIGEKRPWEGTGP